MPDNQTTNPDIALFGKRWAAWADQPSGSVIGIVRLLDRVTPLFAGHPPAVQGAVLAELLALWLAGHAAEGDQAQTDQLRQDLLAAHLASVRELIPLHDARIHGGG